MRPKGNYSNANATVAFVDIAGFSAIADVYGDASAIYTLELFENMVGTSLEGYQPPIKWIGDEAMLAFPAPDMAIQALGALLQACRNESGLPLTRAGVNHGPIIRRDHDIFGSTVNIAARVAARASPGQLLATRPIAEAAQAGGILVKTIGPAALRSVAGEVDLFEIELAPSVDPTWIDPVCKMHAPYSPYKRAACEGPWFCSPLCEEAYRRSPQTYSLTP
ncbi:hypothetical protein JJB09_15760 [Rhizobium sp. KVB221]|uniref:Guanylate cyclase domain-containing protein n=1 Tax=Rhizobium setariae TaxID=2801340 RepID=A0A936YRN0_9HYPH|nr:adenylate/guanylate cyclase domain-containing protein [Rhizobium setariae]MBL0373487.1 hypothetical protein [Rhizobium setariae]